MDWFDSWALSLAAFIPIVGMAAVLAIPRAKEELIKQVALLTTAVTLVVGVIILVRFDYDAADKLQFSVNKSWIDVISFRYHSSHNSRNEPRWRCSASAARRTLNGSCCLSSSTRA